MGKSSLINAITGDKVSIVSDIKLYGDVSVRLTRRGGGHGARTRDAPLAFTSLLAAPVSQVRNGTLHAVGHVVHRVEVVG